MPSGFGGRGDDHAGSYGQQRHSEAESVETELRELTREAEAEGKQSHAGDGERSHGETTECPARDEQGGKAAERNSVHAAEIGVFLPDLVAVGKDGSAEGAEDNEDGEQKDEPAATAEQAAGDGEGEVESFLDGEGPEDIPAAGKVAAVGFEEADAEGERGEEGGSEAADFCGYNEIREMEGVQQAENGKQGEQKRSDAGEAKEVKVADADTRECAPSPERGGSDEETGDGEEDLDAGLTLPDESAGHLRREGSEVVEVSEDQAHVDVIEQNVQDGEGAKGIDAVETRPGPGGLRVWVVSHSPRLL